MNALIAKLTPAQECEVAMELDRLFDLQDRPLKQEKKDLIVVELSATGYPFKAIIAGIRDLVDQDLKQIKFGILKEAARRHFTFEERQSDCKLCAGGFVTMVNKDGYSIAVPCTCERGKSSAEAQSLKQWNGKRSMMSMMFGIMTLVYPDPVKANIPEMSDREYAETAVGNQSQHETSWTD